MTGNHNRDWEKNRYHSDPAGQNYLRYLRKLRARIIRKRQRIAELERELIEYGKEKDS